MALLQCNIDSRGKAYRLVGGLIFWVIGLIVLAVWPMRSGSHLGWVVAIALLAGGMFMIFEARAGWCVVRAMGFKTSV